MANLAHLFFFIAQVIPGVRERLKKGFWSFLIRFFLPKIFPRKRRMSKKMRRFRRQKMRRFSWKRCAVFGRQKDAPFFGLKCRKRCAEFGASHLSEFGACHRDVFPEFGASFFMRIPRIFLLPKTAHVVNGKKAHLFSNFEKNGYFI